MKTAVLACELGGNLGHVGPLLQLARALRREGCRPIFVVSDVVTAAAIVDTADMQVLQAPAWPKAGFIAGRPFRISSYADILALYGFADARGLAAMVAAWDSLLALVKPDLVIADFSPTLCLAAYRTIPIAPVGNGYANPPVHDPIFPPLFYDRPPLMAQTRLLENIHEVQRRRSRPAPGSLTGLFDSPHRSVTTFPELDPYREVRKEPVIGPLERMPQETRLPAEPTIFAYLGEECPALDTIVQCLVELNVGVEAYLRGDVGGLRRFMAARGARVHDHPPNLAEVLPGARVVVSHAGVTTAHAALATGRPQVLLPLSIEADLTAAALVALGVGVSVRRGAEKKDLPVALRTALADNELASRARSCAGIVAARPPVDALASVTNACLHILS